MGFFPAPVTVTTCDNHCTRLILVGPVCFVWPRRRGDLADASDRGRVDCITDASACFETAFSPCGTQSYHSNWNSNFNSVTLFIAFIRMPTKGGIRWLLDFQRVLNSWVGVVKTFSLLWAPYCVINQLKTCSGRQIEEGGVWKENPCHDLPQKPRPTSFRFLYFFRNPSTHSILVWQRKRGPPTKAPCLFLYCIKDFVTE